MAGTALPNVAGLSGAGPSAIDVDLGTAAPIVGPAPVGPRVGDGSTSSGIPVAER